MGTTPASWGENIQTGVIFLAAMRGLTPFAPPIATKSPLLVKIWDRGQPRKRRIDVGKLPWGEAEVSRSMTGSWVPRSKRCKSRGTTDSQRAGPQPQSWVSRMILIRDVGPGMPWPQLSCQWTETTSLDLPALGFHELRAAGVPELTESAGSPPISSLPSRAATAEKTPWPS